MADEATYRERAAQLFQQARTPTRGRDTRLIAALAEESWQAAERAAVRRAAGISARDATGRDAETSAAAASAAVAVGRYLQFFFEVPSERPAPLADLLSRLDAPNGSSNAK
jgi:hypothetical protein